jgi:TRAP-type C4-dicarboxylate transport system substrate-binding protein
MTRRSSVVAVLLATFLAGSAAAQDKVVTMRMSHNVPPTHPVQTLLLGPWAKSIEDDSGGTIKIQMFPAEQLGPAREQYNLARDGIADISWYLVGIEPGRFPIVTAAEIPFLVSDNSKGSRALHEWYAKYSAREMPDVKVCVVFYDGGGTMHANKTIARPADLKGLKIRSPNATAARFYREAGATTVQLSAAEAAEAMERGVADALSFPWNLLRALGIDRAVNHHLDMNFYSLGTAILINKGTYARLSPKQKQVIDNHCTADWAEKLPPPWIKWELEGRAALKADPKHTVYTITEDDKKAWMEIVPKVQAQWEREVAQKGIDGPKAFAELKALLDKYHAGY